MTGRVAIVGSLNADLVVRTERRPAGGETVTGSDLAVGPGGKGANQAVAAARLGAEVAMLGALGDDAFGARLRAAITAEGIDDSAVAELPGVASGTAMIIVDAAGENSIVVSPGANHRVTPDLVAARRSWFDGIAVLGLCLELPVAAVLAAARLGRAAGAQVVLNLSPYAEVPGELLALTDLLLVNEHELALLLGEPSGGGGAGIGGAVGGGAVAGGAVAGGAVGGGAVGGGAVAGGAVGDGSAGDGAAGGRAVGDGSAGGGAGIGGSAGGGAGIGGAGIGGAAGRTWADRARALAERGIGRAIVTLGAAGSVVLDPGGAGDLAVTPVPAVRVTPVDTTGAGDAYTGSVAALLARGRPLVEAATVAGRVAAFSTTRPGAQSSYPSRAEAAELIGRT